MIEWPTRYDWDYGDVTPLETGAYVRYEDFEKLLEHCVDRLDRSDCYADMLHSQIKREILYELSEKEKKSDPVTLKIIESDAVSQGECRFINSEKLNPLNKYVLPYDFDKDAENIADCLGYALRSVRERMSDQLINPTAFHETLGLDDKEVEK